jgi:hypothetical protein
MSRLLKLTALIEAPTGLALLAGTHCQAKKTPRKKKANVSDKFGQSNCVILRDSCNLAALPS